MLTPYITTVPLLTLRINIRHYFNWAIHISPVSILMSSLCPWYRTHCTFSCHVSLVSALERALVRYFVQRLSRLFCLMFSCDETGVTGLRKGSTEVKHPLITSYLGKHHFDLTYCFCSLNCPSQGWDPALGSHTFQESSGEGRNAAYGLLHRWALGRDPLWDWEACLAISKLKGSQ